MNYHFWYSDKLSRLHQFCGDENNKCIILVDGIKTEIEYTHCHSKYIDAGGCKWGDEIYLGEGEISYLGKKPSLDAMFDYDSKSSHENIMRLERSIEFAKKLQ